MLGAPMLSIGKAEYFVQRNFEHVASSRIGPSQMVSSNEVLENSDLATARESVIERVRVTI